MNEALEILKSYIDERIAYVTDDPEWQRKGESERLWEEFVEAFPLELDITPEQLKP